MITRASSIARTVTRLVTASLALAALIIVLCQVKWATIGIGGICLAIGFLSMSCMAGLFLTGFRHLDRPRIGSLSRREDLLLLVTWGGALITTINLARSGPHDWVGWITFCIAVVISFFIGTNFNDANTKGEI
jgi:hypothetical protein